MILLLCIHGGGISLHCMGLHSSAGTALQRERRGRGFESRYNCDDHIFIPFVLPQFAIYLILFHSFHGLMNSINWPACHCIGLHSISAVHSSPYSIFN